MNLAEEFGRQARQQYPNHPLAELGVRVIEAQAEVLNAQLEQVRSVLASRTDDLRSCQQRLDQALARLDEKGDYQVFIVPGAGYLEAALRMLANSPDVREGDHIRVPGTAELVLENGIWVHR